MLGLKLNHVSKRGYCCLFIGGVNFALFRPASQSSQHAYMDADKAVDGDETTLSHTNINDPRPWWKVCLAYPIWVMHVEIFNTEDNG